MANENIFREALSQMSDSDRERVLNTLQTLDGDRRVEFANRISNISGIKSQGLPGIDPLRVARKAIPDPGGITGIVPGLAGLAAADTLASIIGERNSAIVKQSPMVNSFLRELSDKPIKRGIAEFGIDVATDPRTFTPGGLQKKPISGISRLSKFGLDSLGNVSEKSSRLIRKPGKLARGLADISARDIKDFRSLVDRRGVRFVFNPSTEKGEFIGKHLTPHVRRVIERRVSDLEPGTLRQLGVSDNLSKVARQIGSQDMNRVRKSYGGSVSSFEASLRFQLAKKADDSSKFFDDVVSNAPDSLNMNPKEFASKLATRLKKIGKLSRAGKIRPGIGKDNKVVSGLFNTFEDAKNFKGNINKQQWQRTKLNLKGLITGDNEVDRLVFETIDDLDNMAAKSGVEGLREAKDKFRIAKKFLDDFDNSVRIGEKKLERIGLGKLSKRELNDLAELEQHVGRPFIDEVGKVNITREFDNQISRSFEGIRSDVNIKSRLLAAQKEKPGEPSRKILDELLGEFHSKNVGEMMDANRFAQLLGKRGFAAGTSGRARGASRAIVREFEEKIRPKLEGTRR